MTIIQKIQPSKIECLDSGGLRNSTLRRPSRRWAVTGEYYRGKDKRSSGDFDKDGKRRGKRPARETAISITYTSSIQKRSPEEIFEYRMNSPAIARYNGKNENEIRSSSSEPIVRWVKKLAGASIAYEEEESRVKIDKEEAEEEMELTLPLRDYLGAGSIAYAKEIVGIVTKRVQDHNRLMKSLAPTAWEIEGLDTLEAAVLRVAFAEMELGTPGQVAINEATNLAKQYTSPKSAKFINGCLGRFVKENPQFLGSQKSQLNAETPQKP